MPLPTHLIVAASSWLSRIITVLVQLATVKVVITELGKEPFAVFALLTSLVTWYLLADFGVGSSVQNYISEARAKNHSPAEYVSAGGYLSLSFTLILIPIVLILGNLLGPVYLKGFDFLSTPQKIEYFCVTAVLFVFSSVGGCSYKILYAYQRGYLSNIFTAIANILGFLLVVKVMSSQLNDKLYWSFVVFIAPSSVISLLVYASEIKKAVMICLVPSKKIFICVLKRALSFWCYFLLGTVVLGMDYIIISQYVDAENIAIYNVSMRIFGFIFFIYSAILLAVWPVCTESISVNNWSNVALLLKKYIIIGMLFIVVSTLLLCFYMPFISRLLSPNDIINIPMPLISILGTYFIIRVISDTFAMVLQSMSDLRVFWLYVPFQALLSVGLQSLLVPSFGLYGAVTGLIVSFLLTAVWILPLAVRRRAKLFAVSAQNNEH